MRVSKVKHTRMATVVKEQAGQGILYRNPAEGKDASLNISDQLKELNKSAQILYSPLTQADRFITRNNSKVVKLLSNIFKQLVIEIIKENIVFTLEADDIRKKLYINAKQNPVNEQWTNRKVICDQIIDNRLKKSLRRTIKMKNGEKINTKDVAKKILYAAYMADTENLFSLIADDELKAFFELLHEDYHKQKQLADIEKSITCQNVKVTQTVFNGKRILVPSNFDSPQKKYIYDFMRNYSQGDIVQRKKELIHIRELIILYLYGTEVYVNSKDSDIGDQTWGMSLPGDECVIDDVLQDLVSERDHNRLFKGKKEEELKKETSKDYWIRDSIKIKKLNKELTSCKDKLRILNEKIHIKVEEIIAFRYLEAVKAEGISDADKYWLQYFESVIEKILGVGKKGSTGKKVENFKLGTSYLCDRLFKEWTSFIAMKFIDLGKAVYHFAMPDYEDPANRTNCIPGEVLSEYYDGIDSFDYETIAAEEQLSRSLIVHAGFAAGVFGQALVNTEYRADSKGKEDVLSYNKHDWEKAMLPDTKRRILMYFGGKSLWVGNRNISEIEDRDMVCAMQKCIALTRNSSFHYASGKVVLEDKVKRIVMDLFVEELSRTGQVFRKKYFSNNVPAFYALKDIDKLMDHLYKNSEAILTQIPSFNKVFKRKEIVRFLDGYVKRESLTKIPTDDGIIEKYRSGIYFVLKDIYYKGFLKDDRLKDIFLHGMKIEGEKTENPNAFSNFKSRVEQYMASPEATIPGLCQSIMTDYNLQNQGDYRIKSQKSRKEEDGKYEHFRMLLYAVLKNAFEYYLNQNNEVYDFLKEPKYIDRNNDMQFEENFISNWNTSAFDYLREILLKSDEACAWYVAMHFIPRKQGNLLLGDLRSYLQYVVNIQYRKNSVKKRDEISADNVIRIQRTELIVSAVEFAMLFVGNTSNELTDYFKDKDDYAYNLRQFVSFCSGNNSADNTHLSIYCESNIPNTDHKLKIYHDGMNPIINKHIVEAVMYGNEKLLGSCLDAMDMKTFSKYYQLQDELAKIFQRGICNTKEEQGKLREFQNIKNLVELVDIKIFMEIINDFMAQLESYAYLRERDMMYFQLGFQYARLTYGECVEKDSWQRVIKGENVCFDDNAILYQICALYSYDLPLYLRDGTVGIEGGNQFGAKIRPFVKNYCNEDISGEQAAPTYYAGLELFENVKDHDSFIHLRNYIDHMKYLARADKSILELYSDLYNGFFSYDIKLQKSISFIVSNILMKYFVIADTGMRVKRGNNGDSRRYAELYIKALDSDVFIYRFKKPQNDKKGKKEEYEVVKLPVRGDRFKKNLNKILVYKA